MKQTKIILLALAIILLALPLPAKASPSLSTDNYLYTIRDKQVTLAGSGLTPSQQYYLWVRGPATNKTRYTGVSFTPVSGGLIPPDTTYPLSANAELGTYLISLSTSSTTDNAGDRTFRCLGFSDARISKNTVCEHHRRGHFSGHKHQFDYSRSGGQHRTLHTRFDDRGRFQSYLENSARRDYRCIYSRDLWHGDIR